MQPLNLSYLNTNGILTYDANSYLNGNASVNPYAIPATKPQEADSFKKTKTINTVKKVAVGVALAALAVAGYSKCSKGISKCTTAIKNFLGKNTDKIAEATNTATTALSKVL